MPFSQSIKAKARWKSAYRCCVCQDVFVEVHHLIPEADGGPSTIENAAPLCAKHHDLFGGNPEKRAMIRAMRDAWWQEVTEIRAARTDFFERNPPYEIRVNQHSECGLQEKPVLMYHMFKEDQGFATTAQILHELLKKVQDRCPNRRRVLYVDILGHEGKEIPGTTKRMKWDNEMMELQVPFARTFLLQYFWKIHFPLWLLTNDRAQNNNILISDELRLFDGPISYADAIEYAASSNSGEAYIGEWDLVIRAKNASGLTKMREGEREAIKRGLSKNSRKK